MGRCYWAEKQHMLDRVGARGTVVASMSQGLDAQLGVPVNFTGAGSPPHRSPPGASKLESYLAPSAVPVISPLGCEWHSTTYGGVRTLDPRLPGAGPVQLGASLSAVTAGV